MPRRDRSAGGPVFWKITGAGALFQAGSSAVDSATIVASLVNHLTGSLYAVGAASAVLRLGWLLPQLVVGFLAQRAERRMPFYVAGAFGRAGCLALIAAMLAFAGEPPDGGWVAGGFLALWTLYAFVSGIVAVPYNDIVGRAIPSGARSRMLAWRFFGGGVLALGVTALIHRLLATQTLFTAYALIFALAAVLMLASSFSFVSAGEPTAPPNKAADTAAGFGQFIAGGWAVLRADGRFRLFLYTQWLGGAALMALPFYVVAAANAGLAVTDVGILLGAQTAGALASNALWGRIGDRHGKLALLRMVGLFRLAPPLGALVLFAIAADGTPPLAAFAALFVLIGALTNGMTIGYLGYLMEISPDAQRPAYSAYFNALASPAALLPLVGALIADTVSLAGVFGAAILAAVAQLVLYARLRRWEEN